MKVESLPKEQFERFRWVEERLHQIGGFLATAFVVTFFVERFRAHGAHQGEENVLLEVLHWVLLVVDIAVVVAFIVALVFRYVLIKKPNRTWSRMTRDRALNARVANWLRTAGPAEAKPNVRFCSENCIDELSALNYRAFKDSIFAVEEAKLNHRNLAWAKRNKRIFMLIENPFDSHSYLGYSAMLPLTEEGIETYLSGGLKDADIPASLVARGLSSTAGVLLFAIHLRKDFSFIERAGSREFSAYFLACVRYHVQALFGRNASKDNEYPPIYVQTDQGALEKRLKTYGFKQTGRRSADGYKIWMLKRPFRSMDNCLAPLMNER